MILFVIRLIFIFVIESLEGFIYLSLFIFYLIFTLICFILTLISIIKYFIITKGVFRFFENELSDFYQNTKWQIVLEILILIYDIIIIIMIIYEFIKRKSLKQLIYINPINNPGPIIESEFIQISSNSIPELNNLKQKETELRTEYEENENIIKNKSDEKLKMIRKSICNVTETNMNLHNLKNEKNKLKNKMQNLENEKNKLQEMLNNLENLENEIENLKEDIKKKEEDKLNLKQIHDVYNKEYIDIYQKRNQSS